MAHLLIVDDERSICELLEISFRKEGHKVEVASNGEGAKRKLASQMFDMVISDICMPDMDGVELLRYCKELSPATIFILITGVPTIDTAIDAVNFGADRYVIKGDRLLDELRPAVSQFAERVRLLGGAFAVCEPSPDMQQVLTAMKLNERWPIFDSQRAAVKFAVSLSGALAV